MLAPVRIQDHFPVAPEKQLEEVVLYDGPVVTNGLDVILQEPLDSLVEVEILAYGVGGNYQDSKVIKASELVSLLGQPIQLSIFQFTGAGTSGNQSNVRVDLGLSTLNSLRVAVGTTYGLETEGIYKVIGYRKRYATENNSVVIPVNSGNNIAVNSRYEVQLPTEYYDSATGMIKDGVSVTAEIDYDGAVGGEAGWGETGWTSVYVSSTDRRGAGVKATKFKEKVVVQTGSHYILVDSNRMGNAFNIVAGGVAYPVPCRVIATLNDKTAISVPVGDKGYGGLVKTTLATTIADFTVPTVIDFDAAAVTTPLKVVQDATSNTLSINQIGIWETTGNINLGFDTAVGDRQITVEMYNETLGQVAASDTRYIARNQAGDSIPLTIGLVEIQNTGHEYSLRIYSADSFSNVMVNKCRWDVKLYSPL